MKILISGAGIAGLTLAFWLRRQGHELSIIEKSPTLRDEGYMMDFFASGYDVASRMGILDELAEIHYPISQLTFLDASGREKFSISYPRFRELFDNHHFNFMRGDLERVLCSLLLPGLKIRFNTTIKWLQYEQDQVAVEMISGETEKVDLVVGADGVHSRVRELAFGPEAKFKRWLGYYTAAFIIDQRPEQFGLGDAFYTLSVAGKQVGVYPIRGNKIAAFFLYQADQQIDSFSSTAARTELKRVFGKVDWIVPGLLRESENADIYFDEVSQIEMPGWSHHHVVLVGDACQCVSLAAGQGASLAMTGAYILAEELRKNPTEVLRAVQDYQIRLKPAIESKQKAGRRTLKWFAPPTEFRITIRDLALQFGASLIGRNFLKRFLDTRSILREV